jgi:aminoglycoside/choline kinase family phosphotransferase
MKVLMINLEIHHPEKEFLKTKRRFLQRTNRKIRKKKGTQEQIRLRRDFQFRNIIKVILAFNSLTNLNV